jgi:hypothetical protein
MNLIQEIKDIRNKQNFSTMSFINLLSELDEDKAKLQLSKIEKLDSKILELNNLLLMNKTKNKLEILDKITQIREQNNKHWMDAVKMCFELDEKQATEIFTKIRECDTQVRDLYKEITDEGN